MFFFKKGGSLRPNKAWSISPKHQHHTSVNSSGVPGSRLRQLSFRLDPLRPDGYALMQPSVHWLKAGLAGHTQRYWPVGVWGFWGHPWGGGDTGLSKRKPVQRRTSFCKKGPQHEANTNQPWTSHPRASNIQISARFNPIHWFTGYPPPLNDPLPKMTLWGVLVRGDFFRRLKRIFKSL